MNSIISGILNFVADCVTALFDLLYKLFENGIGLNGDKTLAGFFTLFSFCKGANVVFLWAGFFVLYSICVFQLFKAFFGPVTEAESPLPLVIKTIAYTLVVGCHKQICSFVIDLGTIPYKLLQNEVGLLETVDNAYDMSLLSAASSLLTTGITSGLAASAGMIGLLFFIIFLIMLIKEYFKLLIEIVERYVILGLLTTVAPLCLSCGASKATNQITKSFIKMYISQIIVMCFSVFFIKTFNLALGNWLALSIATSLGQGVNFNGHLITSLELPNFFVQGLMILAWLKLGQKVDAHMGQLGLNVAQAGGTADSFFKGMHDGLSPGSLASGIHNGIANKLMGTNFGRNNPGNENMWMAMKNGNLNKKSGILEAARNQKGHNVTGVRPGLAAKANQIASSPKTTFSGKTINDMINDKNHSYGGSTESGGYGIGNALKKNFNLPEDWKALSTSSINGKNIHGEFVDSEGNKHVLEAVAGTPHDGSKVQGTIEGQGELAGMNLSLMNGTTDQALAWANGVEDMSANMSADSTDFQKVENAGSDMQEITPAVNDNLSQSGIDPENAVHWDGNEAIMPPGEEPQREDFKTDEEFEKAHEEWQAQKDAYDSASVVAPDGNIYDADGINDAVRWDGDQMVEAPGEEPQREDFGSDEEFQAAHDEWQAQKDAYDSASLFAPDGNMYNEESLEGLAHWDGNEAIMPPGEEPPAPGEEPPVPGAEPDFMKEPDINDEKYQQIAEQAKADGKSDKEAAAEAREAYNQDMQEWNNRYPDGEESHSYQALKDSHNEWQQKKDAHDEWQQKSDAHNEWQQKKDAYDNAAVFNKNGEAVKANDVQNLTHWNGNEAVSHPGAEPPKAGKEPPTPGEEPKRDSYAHDAKGEEQFKNAHAGWQARKDAHDEWQQKSDAHNEWQQKKDAYDKASAIAPDGKMYQNGATANSDGVVSGTQAATQLNAMQSNKNKQLYDANGEAVSLKDVARFNDKGEQVMKPDRKQFANNAEGQKQFAEAQKTYDTAKLTDNNGHMFKVDANGEKAGMLYADKPQLTNDMGQTVSADQTVRFAKNADGSVKELHPPTPLSSTASAAEKAQYAKDMKEYQNASMVAPNGQVYKSENGQKGEVLSNPNSINSGTAFAKIAAGSEIHRQSATGNLAAAVSNDGQVLMQTSGKGNGGVAGGRAVLENSGLNGHIQNDNGNLVYDKSSNQYVNKDECNLTGDDAHTKFAGTYRDSSGKELTNQTDINKAIGTDGKLNAGYTFTPSTFSSVSDNKSMADSFMQQEQSGTGIQLQTTGHGTIEHFNENGISDKNGGFVKTSDGTLVSADTFKAGADGHVANHALVGTSDNGGYKELVTDSTKAIQTYDGHGNEVANGKGDYVKDTDGNMYSKSSFGLNDEGKVQGHVTDTQSQDHFDSLITAGNGTFQRFNASMVPDDNGQFYGKIGDHGIELVDRSNYETNAVGATRSFVDNGTRYGNVVQTVDDFGQATGFAQLSNPQQWSQPQTYDKIDDNSERGFHYEPNNDGTGKYVSVINSQTGQQDYAQVRATESSTPIDTYQSRAHTAVISNFDGSPMTTEVAGYSAIQGNSGTHFEDKNGDYHEIASRAEGGGIQRYEKRGNEFVKSDNGNYAMSQDPNDPGKKTYHELASDTTYNPQYQTSTGMPVSARIDGTNEPVVEIPIQNVRSTGQVGINTCEVNGKQFMMQSTKLYDTTSAMNNDNTMLAHINGQDYRLIQMHENFDPSINGRAINTYMGHNAAEKAKADGVTSLNTVKSAVAFETNQGTVYADASVPRRKIAATDTEPEKWVTKGTLVTTVRPPGVEGKDYHTVYPNGSKNPVFQMPTQLEFGSSCGGSPKINFKKKAINTAKSASTHIKSFLKAKGKITNKVAYKPTRNQMRGK